MTPTHETPSTPAALYLDLIERCMTNTIYGDAYTDWRAPGVEKPSTLRSGNWDATGPGAPTR